MRLLLDRAGVVVNDLPSVREALPHQREYSAYIILFAFQVPSPEHECRVRPQEAKLQFRKSQLSHRGAVWIVLLVSRQHSIPAAGDTAASRKSQFRGMPVALQEGVNIGAVPGGLLSSEDSANGFLIGFASARRLRRRLSPCNDHKEAQEGACAQ